MNFLERKLMRQLQSNIRFHEKYEKFEVTCLAASIIWW